ncbi:unnamed protein product [Adineta steineri]|uniref:Mitochondrial inner membrane protein Mpv17 n=1 Tax=Adineta steineri TaxID=433720 RepID=A0A819S6M2_9BILA|nr:unnamed protein product [Adineta steineri]
MALAAVNTGKVVMHTQRGWRSLIKPYLLTTVGIGTSVTLGDFICQYLERSKKIKDNDSTSKSFSSVLPWWDMKRSLVMCTSATFVIAPWNFTLSRIIERLFPGRQNIQIVKKMLTNTLFAPVGICLVFISVTLLNGRSLQEAKAKIKNDMLKTFVTGTCYWPFISFINFRYIPLDYRPFVGSLAGAIWNIYISFVAHNTTVENSNNTRQISTETKTKTKTNFLSETIEKIILVLRKILNTSDQNKKDL